MNIQIEPVSKDEKEILRNLLEKYEYEFSQYDMNNINSIGLYGYDYLDNYWTEKNRFAFFIKIDSKLAGFIMFHDYALPNLKTDFTMAEYFVLYRYRKMGIGTYVVKSIFEKYKGRWGLMYHPKNLYQKIFGIKSYLYIQMEIIHY